MQKIGDIPNTRADGNGEFTDGSVAGGIPPTILPAEWFNTIQRELINILTAAGITPDSTKFNQLAMAISKLIVDGDFFKIDNFLSEIKDAGPAAIADAIANLTLSDGSSISAGDALIAVKQPYANALNITQHDQNRFYVSALSYGVDPTHSIDSSIGLQKAVDDARLEGFTEVQLPAGRIRMSNPLIVPDGVSLVGKGVDVWYSYTPDPVKLPKSWDKGTTLNFVGSGVKNRSFGNISNERPIKIVNGVACELTRFTLEDSVGTTPATPRPLSIAVTVTNCSQLRGLRIMLNNNGITGYNDIASISLGDNWDIGLHVYNGLDFYLDNVQVVGYWRVAGTLITENDGSMTQRGNPEREHFSKFYTQGVRGLLIRSSPQIDVVSNTANSVTFKHVKSMRITADNQFRISGSSELFTFTGSTYDGTNITLTGVFPELPAALAVIRYPSAGNNFSGTNFENVFAGSLDHASARASETFGLPVSFAFEIDGYPMRNLKFQNFKAQTIHDNGNSIWGDCKDVKLINSEFENGRMVGYDISETQGCTGNLRLINTDIQSSVDITGFTPRDCFIDYKQMPTRNTNGTFYIKNWREKNLEIQYADSTRGILLRDYDKNAELSNGNGFRYLRSQGSTNGLTLSGAGFDIQNAAGSSMLQGFDASKNLSFAASFTGPTVAVNTAVRPAVPNVGTCGDAAHPWAGGYTQTGFSITSNMLDKQDIKLFTDEVLDAWGHVDWYSYRLIDAVAQKGEQARSHAGLLAQEIMAVFQTYDLDSENLGLVCYESWPESIEVIDGEEVITPAGDSYSVRYTEALCIEAAFNRRERAKLEARIEALESTRA